MLRMHCISFPIIYQRKESGAAAVAVCIITQIPPKARKKENKIKRRGMDAMFSSPQHPLESSRIPENSDCTVDGNSHRNHLSQKTIRMRNKIIHPQTADIMRIVRFKDADTDKEPVFCSCTGVRSLTGIKTAVISADRICTPHSIHAADRENMLLAIPNIKAGPALLQNPNNCSACCLRICPSR